MKTMRNVSSLVVALSIVASIGVTAQQPQSPSTQEALLLAQGFGYLSSGDMARAAAVAGQVLAQFPMSEAGAALAVAVELPRSGWIGALTVYEQWLGARKAEDPYLLRRVARAQPARRARQRQHALAGARSARRRWRSGSDRGGQRGRGRRQVHRDAGPGDCRRREGRQSHHRADGGDAPGARDVH